jgi:outer membrane protein assembly factor BamB
MKFQNSLASRTFLGMIWIVTCGVSSGLPRCHGEDWPQWLGARRDGVSRETGLVRQIPEGGLPVLWRTPVAGGYSGPAVADGRVFVMDYVSTAGTSTNNPGGRDAMQGTERVLAFDAATGKELWKFEYQRPYNLSYANGPRATPTVDGERVYTLGAEGDLLCLRVADGDLVWRKQLAEEYAAETPMWGHAAHPLVHGELLYCLAGGKGSVVVALNKLSGEEVWRAGTASEIGYCPPTIQELGGAERLLIWDAEALRALDPKTGAEFWSYALQPRYGMSISAPQRSGDLLYACGIGETAAMIRLGEDGRPAETLWTGKPKMGLYCANATPQFVGDMLFGSDCGTGEFIAVHAQDGSQAWKTFALTTGGDRRASHGTAFVIRNADHFLIFAETGELIMAELSAAGYQEHGRMQVLEPTGECFGRPVVWSHPALANKKLFVRNDQELVCVDLAEPR